MKPQFLLPIVTVAGAVATTAAKIDVVVPSPQHGQDLALDPKIANGIHEPSDSVPISSMPETMPTNQIMIEEQPPSPPTRKPQQTSTGMRAAKKKEEEKTDELSLRQVLGGVAVAVLVSVV